MNDLIEFLHAQLDEDELWAKAASAPYRGDGPTVPGGIHWTWSIGENWTPVEVDSTASYVGEGEPVQLITVEEWPLSWGASLAGKVCEAEELRTGDAGHIARHDPARVLREVEATRLLLDFLDPNGAPPGEGRYVAERAILLLALRYADRPGYREEWRPA